MKKISSFLLGLLVLCAFQYVLHVFYHSSDELRNNNYDKKIFEFRQEDIDSILDEPEWN